MAIFFSTWVKIGDAAGKDLKKNLEHLLASSTSALRVECREEGGKDVFYIRDRNLFDYLWEKLDAYDSELREMRTLARVAIEMMIRPYVREDCTAEGNVIPLWKRVEGRVLVDEMGKNTEPSVYQFSRGLLTSITPIDGFASVPDGLSLCNAPPTVFLANAILSGSATSNDHSKTLGHMTYSKIAEIVWPYAADVLEAESKDFKTFYLLELRNNYRDGYSSMVISPKKYPSETALELSDMHVENFLKAVKEFIEERKRLNQPVSVLIAAEDKKQYLRLQKKMLGTQSIHRIMPGSEEEVDDDFKCLISPKKNCAKKDNPELGAKMPGVILLPDGNDDDNGAEYWQ